MMPLASIGGLAVWIVIALIVGAVKHLGKAQPESGNPPPIPGRRPSSADGNSEEERTRRFMEALGLPPHNAAKTESQQPMRPTMETAREIRRGMPAADAADKRLARRLEENRHKAERQARGAATLKRASVEATQLASLQTPKVPEFHTVSSVVTAIPFDLTSSVAGQLYQGAENALSVEVRELVRSPAALRSAILVREILGPPRSLQSLDPAPTLSPP